jgi:hypothetical protein
MRIELMLRLAPQLRVATERPKPRAGRIDKYSVGALTIALVSKEPLDRLHIRRIGCTDNGPFEAQALAPLPHEPA